LPQRQPEQNPDPQAEPDRAIRKHRSVTGPAIRRREPGSVLVQPDQRRAAPAQPGSTAGPGRNALAGGCRFAHAPRPAAWIHVVDPARAGLRTTAPAQGRRRAICRSTP
jgi:hypothetical protein